MINNNATKTYNITAKLIPVDEEIIKVYMQGAVYAFCNTNKGEAFSVRILFAVITEIGAERRCRKSMITI